MSGRGSACNADFAQRAERGFSLVELVVFIVVVGLGLAGVLAVLNLGAVRSADPQVRKQALMIAEQMLEEISLQPFTAVAGGCTYAARGACNDIFDYHGFSSSTILDIRGDPVSGLSAYSVSVSVVATSDLAPIPSSDAAKITVSVTGGGETISLAAYRTKYD